MSDAFLLHLALPAYVALAFGFTAWYHFVAERDRSAPLRALRRFIPSALQLRAAIGLLVLCLLARVVIVIAQVHAPYPQRWSWLLTLPLPVYDGRFALPAVYTLAAIAVAGIEVAALCVVWRSTVRPTDRTTQRLILVAIALLAACSLAAPALSSTDVYEYVEAGSRWWAAYRTDAYGLVGPYAQLYAFMPQSGLIYGPVWLAIDASVTALGSSVIGKIFALRLFNATLVALTGWIMVRFGWRRGALLFVLNPVIWFEAVVNAHSDLWGLTPVVAAYAFVRTRRYGAATASLAPVGAVKLPFLLIALAPLTEEPALWRRLLSLGAAIAVTLLVPLAIRDQAYAHTLLGYSGHQLGRNDQLFAVLRLATFALSALWIGVAFLRGRPSFASAWLAPLLSLAPLPYPWYTLWGIPYAMARDQWLIFFLALLPLWSFL
ncbi:MAG: hypothetical protein JO347_06880 [Candidatus Eremiobacteraeota bacterium]|nr:hypothetical protein [Candidatus Eremiobacteraeota bacterium]